MAGHFEPSCLATAIGSMPHKDPHVACRDVSEFLPDLPAWPQLPRRSFKENMYVQFSENFPGVEQQAERICVKRGQVDASQLESLYRAYLEDAPDAYAITREYAAGLHAFLESRLKSPIAVKGQVVGPISWGLSVTDEERRPLIYDVVMADAMAKHLRLKAKWQEGVLKAVCPRTVIFVDEPYLASIGSAFVSVPRDQVVSLLGDVLQGMSGLKGVHCCGNTDWTLLLDAPIDILSFDAYNYAQSFSLYPQEVRRFIERGGIIAWGIVPNEEKALEAESPSSIKDRLEEVMAPFTRKGVPFRRLKEQALLTPSCGLAQLPVEAASRALELLRDVSITMRKRV